MATVKAKLNVCRASKSGKYPVVLQIIHRRKRRVIGTGIKLMPEDFDMRRERVIRRVDSPYRQSEIAAMNRRIGELRSMLTERLARLEGRDYTVDDITVWVHHQSDRKYLFPYFEQLIDEKMKARKWGIAYAYRATIRSLKGFCGSDSLQLADVDARFVRNYELYLQCQGISLNTIAYYLRNLRTVYNRAEADGLLRLPGGCSPFQKVKMAPVRTVKRALTPDQLRTVAALDLTSTPKLEFARDMFMASFYLRGIPFIDQAHLLRKNLVNGSIFYYRQKTGMLVEVEIIEPLRYLIDRYTTDSPYLFPLLFSDADLSDSEGGYTAYRKALYYFNRRLKQIGKLAGLNVPLTSYVARHSWATIAKSKGASTAMISEGLGHSSERITQVYLKSFDSREIDRLNSKVSAL